MTAAAWAGLWCGPLAHGKERKQNWTGIGLATWLDQPDQPQSIKTKVMLTPGSGLSGSPGARWLDNQPHP